MYPTGPASYHSRSHIPGVASVSTAVKLVAPALPGDRQDLGDDLERGDCVLAGDDLGSLAGCAPYEFPDLELERLGALKLDSLGQHPAVGLELAKGGGLPHRLRVVEV